MGSPPTITGIEAEEVRGDVMRLLPALERALRATEGCLRAGLTVSENVRAYVRTARIKVPDDWVPVTAFDASSGPATEFGGGFESTAYRMDERGRVYGRGHLNIPTFGALAILYTLPEGYRPGATVAFTIKRMDVGNEVALGQVRTDGSVRSRLGTGGAPYSVYFEFDTTGAVIPAWTTTTTLEVPTDWRPARVVVLDYRYVVNNRPEQLRRTTGAGRVQWSEQTSREGKRTVRVERIFGLSPGTTYDITLGFFPE